MLIQMKYDVHFNEIALKYRDGTFAFEIISA